MKPNIALLTGGYSGEAVVSYQSVVTIEKNLSKERYNIYKIDISREGWFYMGEERIPVDKNDFSIVVAGEKVLFDGIFIGIHGTPGEDGKLQGYFDMLGLPYTSCDAATSALTFNKSYTVSIAAFRGIDVAKSVLLLKESYIDSSVVRHLKFPVFVKPNNGGSSIGMSLVLNPSDSLEAAIEKAFKEDNQVLVEEFIEGREFTIGVFKSKGEVITLPITEVKSKNKFFDFEAKYTKGMANETTPAQIPEAQANQVRETAKRVYKEFNCAGVVRMDFIYHATENRPYLLEINTIPGQTEASLVPQQVAIMGWSLGEFYTALVEEAIAKRK